MGHCTWQLEEFLKVCDKSNITLAPKKFQYAAEGEALVFAGFKLGSKGCTQDPHKMEAIKDYPRPKDRTTLKRFLGLCAQFQMWFPDITAGVKTMRSLLLKCNE